MPAHYGKFVAYFRVSTDRQGKSGLGLDAQRESVMNYLNGGRWTLIDEFTEVESGKRNDRPEACKKQKSKLVIAATLSQSDLPGRRSALRFPPAGRRPMTTLPQNKEKLIRRDRSMPLSCRKPRTAPMFIPFRPSREVQENVSSLGRDMPCICVFVPPRWRRGC